MTNREKFEGWFLGHWGFDAGPYEQSPERLYYFNDNADEQWQSWQASRAAALEEAAPKWTSITDELPACQDMYLVRYTGDGGYDLLTMEAVIDNQHDLLEWMPVPHNNARDGSSHG
jgi:hypothetical protein